MQKIKAFVIIALSLILCVYPINSNSILIKTQDYSFMNYPRLEGLSYPEYISYVDSEITTVFFFSNITSGETWANFSMVKSMMSSCVWALVNVDYGYYTKFPYYEIVGDCRSSTQKLLYTIKFYRSGQFQVIPGDIQSLGAAEKNCELGNMKVQSYYSSAGSKRMAAYRYCQNPVGKTGVSILYRYKPSAKKIEVLNETNLEKTLGLSSNYQTVDVIPANGENGNFTALLSKKYGLVISNGLTRTPFTIPDNQLAYKLTKICWEDTFAILTQKNVYFFKLKIENSNYSTIVEIKKVKKNNIFFAAEQCKFFSIGKNAVCSYDYDGRTYWYVYGLDRDGEHIESFNEVIEPAYIEEDLCSSGSFYIKNSRFQFYEKNLKSETLENNGKQGALIGQQLALGKGRTVDFVDSQYLVFVNLVPVNSTTQQIIQYAVKKSNLSNIYTLFSQYVSLNTSNPKIIGEVNSNSLYSVVSVIFTDYKTGNTTFKIHGLSKSMINFQEISTSSYGLSIDNFVLLSASSTNLYKRNFVGYTPIEVNTVARLTISNNVSEIYYPYEFEAANLKICSAQSQNQVLLFRVDPQGLVVIRAGFRNQNTLVLDDIRVFKQYDGYTFECANEGILGYNSKKGSIVQFDSALVVKDYGILKFSEIKFTKSLLLLKREDKINIHEKGESVPIISKSWNLSDVVTNIQSDGFFNVNEGTYYEFQLSKEKNLRGSQDKQKILINK